MVLIFGQDHLHQRHVAVAPIRNGILLSQDILIDGNIDSLYFGNASAFCIFGLEMQRNLRVFDLEMYRKKRIFWFGNAYLLLVLFGFLKISCIFAPCF